MDKDAGELAGLLIRLGRMTAAASEASAIESYLLDVVLDPAGVAAAAAAIIGVEPSGLWRIRQQRGLPPAVTEAGWSLSGAPPGPAVGASLEQAWAAAEPLSGDGRLRDVREARTLLMAHSQKLFGVLVIFGPPAVPLTGRQVDLAGHLAEWVAVAFDRGSTASASRERVEQAGTLAAELDEVIAPLALQTELLRRRLQGQAGALEIVEMMEESLQSAASVLARLRPPEQG